MQPELSFEQAPPISVPYRFFLTAPVFGVAAGMLLLWEGEALMQSRWSPATLAWVHLMTAGFMLQAMCGALLQFVPVAVGLNVSHGRQVAGLAHPLLAAGCGLLAAGFLTGAPIAFLLAVIAILAGGGVFLAAVGGALWRPAAVSPAVRALRLALLGLAVALGIGGAMAGALGRGIALPLLELTALHAAFGFGAWGLVLLVGVALYVVPMFQLTPAYPRWIAAALPVSAWIGAALAVLPLLPSRPASADLSLYWLLGTGAVFALITLWLQARRRRRATDPTFWYFRWAMAAALLAAAAGLLRAAAPAELDARLVLSIGVLVIGAFVATISGMLYKIVPFINWLHLQRQMQAVSGPASLPPSMRSMIPEPGMRRQMTLYFLALAVLLAAVWWPGLARPAGLLWTTAAAWLFANLAGGVRRYAAIRDRIRADAADRES